MTPVAKEIQQLKTQLIKLLRIAVNDQETLSSLDRFALHKESHLLRELLFEMDNKISQMWFENRQERIRRFPKLKIVESK